MDPRIRLHTEMSWIRNTDYDNVNCMFIFLLTVAISLGNNLFYCNFFIFCCYRPGQSSKTIRSNKTCSDSSSCGFRDTKSFTGRFVHFSGCLVSLSAGTKTDIHLQVLVLETLFRPPVAFFRYEIPRIDVLFPVFKDACKFTKLSRDMSTS